MLLQLILCDFADITIYFLQGSAQVIFACLGFILSDGMD
jgi:hypothetical protein